MSDAEMRAAFEKAIAADPKDYVSRLAYADFLEERDEPELAALHRRSTPEALERARAEVEEWGYGLPTGLWSFDDPLDALQVALSDGSIFAGDQEGLDALGINDEVWDAYELLTGRPLPHDRPADVWFRCAC